jgi:hypothetical protein
VPPAVNILPMPLFIQACGSSSRFCIGPVLPDAIQVGVTSHAALVLQLVPQLRPLGCDRLPPCDPPWNAGRCQEWRIGHCQNFLGHPYVHEETLFGWPESKVFWGGTSRSKNGFGAGRLLVTKKLPQPFTRIDIFPYDPMLSAISNCSVTTASERGPCLGTFYTRDQSKDLSIEYPIGFTSATTVRPMHLILCHAPKTT